jgi:N-acetylglucosaminyldiphosphoundecaprenol N-acetyl-beta-D-mannosaminyltransferase
MMKNLQKPDLAAPSVSGIADPEAFPHRGNSDVSALRRDDFDRDVWCLLGLPIDISDIDQAVGQIDSAARTGSRLSFVTPNVNWLARVCRDASARREIINADLSLIDGAPLVAMAKALGLPVRTRVAGSDLFEAMRRRPAFAGRRLKVFFFGGRDGAAEKAAHVVNIENGGVEAVGWCNPGFGDIEAMSSREVLEKINDAAPDFVVVALGAAKGQAWIDRNQSILTAPVIAHLGAVVDFTAGGVRRAPKFVQKLGMEWAWRIKEEPALWRRYVDDGLALAGIVFTKLLPQMGLAPKKASGRPADAAMVQGAAAVTIRLSGDLQKSALQPVRAAFRQAVASGADIVLDFAEIGSFDQAFLGLVLMLEKNTVAQGAKIFLRGADHRQMRVLRANNMHYPSDEIAGEHLAIPSTQGSAA